MSDLVQLTDAEVDLVAGGQLSAGEAAKAGLVQANISTITQSASAANSGAVTASGSGAIAIGAAASNTALVGQENLLSFRRD